MNRREWMSIGAGLVALSALTYYLHFRIFHDAHHIFLYLVGDIAFMFLDVALVTLVIDRLLHSRAKAAQAHKMNMVIGAFFSSVGRDLLHALRPMVEDTETITARTEMTVKSTPADFETAVEWVERTDFNVTATPQQLSAVRALLRAERGELLRMLENPVLLEHATFTDMLWSVSHLADELCARKDFANLPETDLLHLGGDVDRAFTRLIAQWMRYLTHLHNDYPYLYSFAIRANPLRAEEDVTVYA